MFFYTFFTFFVAELSEMPYCCFVSTLYQSFVLYVHFVSPANSTKLILNLACSLQN